jgi:hypothetical protein
VNPLKDAPQIRRGKVDNSVKVRQALYERLSRFDFTPEQLADKSLYQIISILFLMAGHLNYLPCWTTAIRTLEETLGEQALYGRIQKDENIVTETEPRPKMTVH